MSGHGEHESHAGITAEIRARAGAEACANIAEYARSAMCHTTDAHGELKDFINATDTETTQTTQTTKEKENT